MDMLMSQEVMCWSLKMWRRCVLQVTKLRLWHSSTTAYSWSLTTEWDRMAQESQGTLLSSIIVTKLRKFTAMDLKRSRFWAAFICERPKNFYRPFNDPSFRTFS